MTNNSPEYPSRRVRRWMWAVGAFLWICLIANVVVTSETHLYRHLLKLLVSCLTAAVVPGILLIHRRRTGQVLGPMPPEEQLLTRLFLLTFILTLALLGTLFLQGPLDLKRQLLGAVPVLISGVALSLRLWNRRAASG